MKSNIEFLLSSGKKILATLIRCMRCGSNWTVQAGSEFQPSYCCYCGTKFTFYEDTDGTLRNIAGFETIDEGELFLP